MDHCALEIRRKLFALTKILSQVPPMLRSHKVKITNQVKSQILHIVKNTMTILCHLNNPMPYLPSQNLEQMYPRHIWSHQQKHQFQEKRILQDVGFVTCIETFNCVQWFQALMSAYVTKIRKNIILFSITWMTIMEKLNLMFGYRKIMYWWMYDKIHLPHGLVLYVSIIASAMMISL